MQKQRNTIAFISLLVFLCLRVNKKNVILSLSKNLFFLILFFNSLFTYSQEIQNPSFEGVYGVARTPQGWTNFGKSSSPDTQPGAWRVTTPASHGESYISMVCRGNTIIDSYLWEACYQQLTNPLFIGKTYNYSIDLAYATTFNAGNIPFDSPVNLRVWGMSNNSEKEILWESGAVSNTDWETFYFKVNPTIAADYLVLEAYYTELPKYCGNILIDNMQYYPEEPIIVQQDSVPDSVVIEPIVEIDPDFEVELNKDGFPENINDREVTQQREVVFKGDKITITLWDNQTFDGDIVSLFLNEKTILKEFTISKEKHHVEVDVSDGKEYYLTLYAHNLGKIPPNTIALFITDGHQKKFIRLSSNLKACGAVKIKIEQELVGAGL